MIQRLNLSQGELDLLSKIVASATLDGADGSIEKSLLEKIANPIQIDSSKKINATGKANKAKISKSKKKVENAMNLLRMEEKEISPNAIAKTAGISYNTAKKYMMKAPVLTDALLDSSDIVVSGDDKFSRGEE